MNILRGERSLTALSALLIDNATEYRWLPPIENSLLLQANRQTETLNDMTTASDDMLRKPIIER
jgi:hypothetical protein